MYYIIEKKRNNKTLTKQEIEFVIENYVNNNISDEEMSAFLMAIYFNGLNERELNYFTNAMKNSGETVDLSSINGITVDKHSTGGVGDKTTLIVGPIVASLGYKVAKMSGKSLGFTGGTIDKLESIKDLKTDLTKEEFFKQVNEIGLSIISQSKDLVPADKKIYALRDKTGTIESIPLIASSIMSKKLASGSKCILLDVKLGSGAFMKTKKDAITLAQTMVKIGKNNDRKMMVLITNMDVPLGNKIGNYLEVSEAIDILNNKGPKDLRTLCIEIATYMVYLCTSDSINKCRSRVIEVLKNGKAYQKFLEMVKYQHGQLTDMKSRYEKPIHALSSGYITYMDSEEIGNTSHYLINGETLDYNAGIVLTKKTGDKVKKDDIIAYLYCDTKEKLVKASLMYNEAIVISNKKIKEKPLIYKIIK